MSASDSKPYIEHAPPSRVHVYLAGPVLGCTEGEANDWRLKVDGILTPYNIYGQSPLRCEPLRGPRYSATSADPKFGTAEAIASKNWLDTIMAKMGMYYIPKPVATEDEVRERFAKWAAVRDSNPERLRVTYEEIFAAGMENAKVHSVGTVIEMAWMKALNKPTILVSDWDFMHVHPVALACANWRVRTLEDACEIMIGVLGGYAGGKNV